MENPVEEKNIDDELDNEYLKNLLKLMGKDKENTKSTSLKELIKNTELKPIPITESIFKKVFPPPVNIELKEETKEELAKAAAPEIKITLGAHENLSAYCKQPVLDKIMRYIEITNTCMTAKEGKDSCMVCLEEFSEKMKEIYFECKHKVCDICFQKMPSKLCQTFENPCHKLSENQHHKSCPACRKPAIPVRLSTKYVILCLGDKAYRSQFENGGYQNVYLFFFPDNTSERINNVTFQKNVHLIDRILWILDSGYTLVVQDFYLIKKWLKEVDVSILDDIDLYPREDVIIM